MFITFVLPTDSGGIIRDAARGFLPVLLMKARARAFVASSDVRQSLAV
jgi:hypothetical protein